jgi:hypothetical protein
VWVLILVNWRKGVLSRALAKSVRIMRFSAELFWESNQVTMVMWVMLLIHS